MRKIVLFLLSITYIALFAQESYTINFKESDFSVNIEDSIVKIATSRSDAMRVGDIESPCLPYFAYRILIPQSQTTENYQISVTKRLLYKDIYVLGNSQVVPTNAEVFDPDNHLATKSVLSPVHWGGDNNRSGFKYGYFNITPFVYDAESRALYFVSSVSLIIPPTSAKAIQTKEIREDRRLQIKELLYNPDKMDDYYPKSDNRELAETNSRDITENIDYLIITRDSLVNSFEELARWKTMKGVRTEIVSVESILSNTSYSSYSTPQLKIKACLYDYKTYHGLQWAVLGGDDAIVPVQYCTGTGNNIVENGPTDLFYACFNGAFDWNGNGNGVIGEISDNVNLEPQIYLTRLPVRTNTDVNAITNKILKYEQDPCTSDYVEKVLLAGCLTYAMIGNMSDSHVKSEVLYGSYIGNPISKTCLYDTYSAATGYTAYDLTNSNLVSEINNGHHFIHVCSHGNYNSWIRNGSFYTCSDASAQTNTESSIIVTEACHTNKFDSGDYTPCLSEAFIRNADGGALAYFGSSRYGWTFKDFSPSYGPSFDYDCQFFNKLLHSLNGDLYHFGAVSAEAKLEHEEISNDTNNAQYEYYRWLQYFINPIGDAEMPIYTTDPTQINATVTRSGTNVYVQVTDNTACDIVLTSIDEAHTILLKPTSQVSSYTFTNITEPYNIVITKHNRIPYVYDYMKPARTNGIIETTQSGSTIYSLTLSPDSVTINWSLPSPYNNLVQVNSSNQSQCTLSSTGTYPITTTLTATVMVNGRFVESFTKEVTIYILEEFSGTYSQGACSYNGVSHPAIPATAYTANQGTTFFIHQGCTVTLTSNNFAGKTVTYGGPATPSGWYRSDNTHVTFSLPSSTNGLPLYVYVQDANNNTLYTSIFMGVFNNGNLYGYSMVVNPIRSGYEISVVNDGTNQEGRQDSDAIGVLEWDLEVYHVTKGTKILSAHVKGDKYQLDTTGWEPGLYAIRAIVNGEVMSEKIIIQ